ncbi:Transcriptional regulator [Frankia sp. AiPs1]|uniref:TetR/AcrR family transcriptional regulator n=1 Tax=Frankia sp. AiPa1 TaxID=573492 RepID=UPI00202B1042|nr:TetR/AcrR family transcriptional regulator [Frankia sp. AiPa1]MCL9762939.1 TetR/AcrR family transcriptional regulator [Frankia sp. AiPa1]
MTASGRPTLRVDAARNYDRIIAAADDAFQADGSAVTLEQVARRAGVGVATVYRHFPSRDHLLQAVFERLVTRLRRDPAQDGDDPWRDLADALAATVEALAARQVILALVHESGGVRASGIRSYYLSMERLLQRAQAAGRARPDVEARDLGALVVMALATVRSDDPAGLDWRRYLCLLLDGLRPAPTPLPPPLRHDLPT